LLHQIDIVGFHAEATRLLARQVPPDTVEWTAAAPAEVDQQVEEAARAQVGSRAARAIIPQSFVRMSELVVLHRDAARFDLLYRSLWRLVYEPELKNDFGDADLARLRQMAQAVRRDMQKMRSRMEFQPMVLKGRPMAVCWYEPAHYIAESVGASHAKAHPDTHWLLLTPDRSLRWDGERLLAAPGLPAGQQPANVPPAAWPALLEAQSWL
jgi:DNA polymerase